MIFDVFRHVLRLIDLTLFIFITALLLDNIKRIPVEIRVFSIFLGIAFIIGFVSLTLAQMGINNHLFSHILLFVQLIWIPFFYYNLLRGSKFGLVVLAVTLLAFFYITTEYIFNWNTFKGGWGGTLYFITNILFVIYAIGYYAYGLSPGRQIRYPYINAAIVIYFSGSSGIFLFANYITSIYKAEYIVFWIINTVLHLVFLILLYIEAWKLVSQGRTTSSS